MRINYPHFTHGERQTQVNFAITTGLELLLFHSLWLLPLNYSPFLAQGCIETYMLALLEKNRYFFPFQKTLVCQYILAKAVVNGLDTTSCKFLPLCTLSVREKISSLLQLVPSSTWYNLHFVQQWLKTIEYRRRFVLPQSDFRICVLCFCPTQIKWVRLELCLCLTVYSTGAFCRSRSGLRHECTKHTRARSLCCIPVGCTAVVQSFWALLAMDVIYWADLMGPGKK